MSIPPKSLQTFYYLEHFMEMVQSVEDRAETMFGQVERDYLKAFRSLSRDGQALHVRLANRKGTAFVVGELDYAEIACVKTSVEELTLAGFVSRARHEHLNEVLVAMTKPQLISLLKASGVAVKASMKKAELIQCGVDSGCVDVPSDPPIIVKQKVEVLEFLRFLYFGQRRDGMELFAMRDLGIVKANSGEIYSRFSDRKTARALFHYSRLSERVKNENKDGLRVMAREVSSWPREGCPEVDARFHQLVGRLGAALERAGLEEEALAVFSHSDCHPARERCCRLLFRSGARDAAKRVLDAIFECPSTDEELVFAEDFSARKFGGERLSSLTKMLRSAPEIIADEAYRDSAERAAALHYSGEGWAAYFSENRLWASLFFMVFDDELHVGEGGAAASPFDPRPVQWLDGSFSARQSDGIEKKLEMVERGEVGGLLDDGAAESAEDAAMVRVLLSAAPGRSLAGVLRWMVSTARGGWSGFPDLMLVRDGELRFVEIKGEGDQLRRNQLARLMLLEASGFDVGVLRVRWGFDPMQEYVVVDVETTGGRADLHRVTEIGAVKIRGGEVIDRFESLLNPERTIPQMITRLTGISDAMVADAPVFIQVAQEFRRFVGGAVFVAHNAKFDYGFLRQEFRRVGEEFHCPTLCTVVMMRKFFPGLESYKLIRLCEEFGIALDSHHRALCDAEATAQLLMLINAKRG